LSVNVTVVEWLMPLLGCALMITLMALVAMDFG